jgi:hypothetical protein
MESTYARNQQGSVLLTSLLLTVMMETLAQLILAFHPQELALICPRRVTMAMAARLEITVTQM